MEVPWVLHDIRRGAATGMGDAGIREAAIARILAHSPKGFLGVTRTYERSDRSGEIREALERWAEVLSGAVEAQADIPHRLTLCAAASAMQLRAGGRDALPA